ncbi:MAG: PfkB family carbohydrate kinase [Candidatus Sulfopaludibacter sp.]|nr:PfkB family carbohydrate kinase [Candidatus Sulfopaludibacter sp.]
MTAADLLCAFRKLKVLVAGDVCLDRWCGYDPSLADPSRETGIPRIGVVATEVTPGAAGTVASNVAALGAKVSVLGAIGEDGFAWELRRALDSRGIAHELLLSSPEIATFTYTKLLRLDTGVEDLPRVDFVNTKPLPAAIDSQLVRRLEAAAPQFDVILVCDQAETSQGGIVTQAMRQRLERIPGGRLVWVDSRMRAELFRRAVVKPNREEAEAACLRVLGRVDYAAFRRHIEAPILIVTHGGDGALLVDANGETWVPTHRVEHPVDICGAGDSFSAGAALTLKVTGDPVAAVRFGNRVASITIMKKGTGTASPEEVLAGGLLSG